MSIKHLKSGEETSIGKIVHTFWKDERIMSDVWEVVHYAIAVLTNGTYQTIALWEQEATVDATPEEIVAYFEHLKAENLAAAKRAADYRAAIEAAIVRIGKTVQVVRGRNVPIGTVGKVFWMGETTWGKKVGIALDDTKDAKGRYANVQWVYQRNVEVVQPVAVAA